MNWNEIKLFENGKYIKSIKLDDFIEVMKEHIKSEHLITTNNNDVIIKTGFRELWFRF